MLNSRRNKIIGLAGGALLLAAAAGTGFAVANGGDDEPLTGAVYDRATAAALAYTGAGEVVETEIGDDGAAYEVEIRMPDGTVVDVGLDNDFRVIGSEADDDTSGESDD